VHPTAASARFLNEVRNAKRQAVAGN
jgi:hypothetical protein